MSRDPSETGGSPIELSQHYQGASTLMVLTEEWSRYPLPAAIPCTFQGLEGEYVALLDTGSQFCLIPPGIASQLDLNPHSEPRERISTRFGVIEGACHPHSIRIRALGGQDLELEARWVVSAEWLGPVVLGWIGFLESIVFGCNPGATSEEEGRFYFALLSEPAVGVDAELRYP